MSKKKEVTTHDRLMASMTKEERLEYEKEYRELLLSELMHAIMADEEVSVRALAKAAGVSATVIQGMRSGARKNVTARSFLQTLQALGYRLEAVKNERRVVINPVVVAKNQSSSARLHTVMGKTPRLVCKRAGVSRKKLKV